MSLRVIAQLPDSHIYKQILQTENYTYVYEDKATHLVRISSNLQDLWGKDLEIRIRVQQGKSANNTYPLRLNLQAFPIEQDLIKCRIIREDYLGKFGYTENTKDEILGFYCLPSVSVNATNPRWITYSICRV